MSDNNINIRKCCRLCLSNEDNCSDFKVDTVFQKRFSNIFRFELTDWGESKKCPKLVCQNCYSIVNKFHEFYEIVLESKAKIIEIIHLEEELPTFEIESSPEPEHLKSPKIEACEIYDGEIEEDPDQLPSGRKAIFMNRNPNKLLLQAYDLCCPKCDNLKFARYEDLDEHHENVHKEKGYIICCQKMFRSKTLAIDHAEWHQNPVIFDCAFNCPGAEFKDRKSLREHENNCKYLENERYFKCNICFVGFFTESEVIKHETETHGYTRPLPQPPIPNPVPVIEGSSTYVKINRVGKKTRYNCRICHKINYNAQELKIHLYKVHQKAIPSVEQKEKEKERTKDKDKDHQDTKKKKM